MKTLSVVLALVAILLIGCGTEAGSPTAQPTPTVDITSTPAYQLAQIDAKGAPPDKATVARYQKVLDSLHDKTGDSEVGIGNATVEGQKILQEDHYTGDDSLYTLMQGCDQAITKDSHQKYAQVLGTLITLMGNNR